MSCNVISAPLIRENKNKWIKAYETVLFEDDLRRLNESQSLQILPHLPLFGGTQKYLQSKIPIKYKKIITQLRLVNKYKSRIIIKGKIITFESDLRCDKCGRDVTENLFHLLIECSYYEEERKMFLTEDCEFEKITELWLKMLSNSDISSGKKIYVFKKSVITQRILKI